jgi:hypothetical protein
VNGRRRLALTDSEAYADRIETLARLDFATVERRTVLLPTTGLVIELTVDGEEWERWIERADVYLHPRRMPARPTNRHAR